MLSNCISRVANFVRSLVFGVCLRILFCEKYLKCKAWNMLSSSILQNDDDKWRRLWSGGDCKYLVVIFGKSAFLRNCTRLMCLSKFHYCLNIMSRFVGWFLKVIFVLFILFFFWNDKISVDGLLRFNGLIIVRVVAERYGLRHALHWFSQGCSWCYSCFASLALGHKS